jgi:hypothetical protein
MLMYCAGASALRVAAAPSCAPAALVAETPGHEYRWHSEPLMFVKSRL